MNSTKQYRIVSAIQVSAWNHVRFDIDARACTPEVNLILREIGKLEKLQKVITNRRQRKLVEAGYFDVASGCPKCWTCCLQKKSAPGCTAQDHHIAA